MTVLASTVEPSMATEPSAASMAPDWVELSAAFWVALTVVPLMLRSPSTVLIAPTAWSLPAVASSEPGPVTVRSPSATVMAGASLFGSPSLEAAATAFFPVTVTVRSPTAPIFPPS